VRSIEQTREYLDDLRREGAKLRQKSRWIVAKRATARVISKIRQDDLKARDGGSRFVTPSHPDINMHSRYLDLADYAINGLKKKKTQP
jgi:hypothetical protein